jgi:hypothetical protein
VRVRRSDYHWALDLDQRNAAAMVSWQRPVFLRSADHVVPVIFDTARTSHVRSTCREVFDAISAAHEVASRDCAGSQRGLYCKRQATSKDRIEITLLCVDAC